MKLLIYITFLAINQAEIISNRKCDNVVVFNTVQYEKEILVKDYDSPYQLAIDPTKNALFFSYSTESNDEAFKSVYLDLVTKKHEIITGIKGGFAHAVDVANNIVYIGSSESGLAKFDYETKKAVPLNITNMSIWQMFYKDGLFFTTYPEEETYLYKNGVISKVKQLEHTKALVMAVDNNQNILFSNSSGLFICKNENVITHMRDDVLNGFSSDSLGNLYYSTPTGIYKMVGETSVKEILRSNDIFGFAVEGENNIVYATKNSIIRLKPTQIQCSTKPN